MHRALGKLAFVAVLAALACRGAGPGGARPAPDGPPLSLDGIHLTRFAGATPLLRLEARRLRVYPRQLGPFRVGTLHQATLSQVRCDLVEPREPRGGAPAGPAALLGGGAGLAPGGAAARVSAVAIHDLDCALVRGGERIARLTAAHAETAGGAGALELRRLVLERLPAGPVLRAPAARWSLDTNTVTVRGRYELSGAAPGWTGEELRVDLDLRQLAPPNRAFRAPSPPSAAR